MEILHFDIQVTGGVQGVWFRKFTKEAADRIGVKGFARNEMDRSVYIEAEGNKMQLDEFVNWLYRGSPMSNVLKVAYKTGALKYFNLFEIRH